MMPLTINPNVLYSGTSIGFVVYDASGNETLIQSFTESTSQIIQVSAGGGTAGVTFNGQTASGINPGDVAATVQTALQGLSSIGSGNVLVTGDHPWLATFSGTLVSTAQPLFTINSSSLTSAGSTPSLTAGSTALAFYSTSSSGQFALVGSSWVVAGSPFGGSLKTTAVGNGLQSGEWTITGLAAGCYVIYIDVDVPSGIFSQSTPVRVYDGITPRFLSIVNQQNPPFHSPLAGNSGRFLALATAYIGVGGIARILITDQVASPDIGKSVLLNQIALKPIDPTVPQIFTPGIDTINAVESSGWGSFFESSSWHGFHVASGTPGSTITWYFPGLMVGTYSVQFLWLPAGNLSTAMPYQIFDGPNLISSGTLNETLSPTGGLTESDGTHSFLFQNLGSSFVCSTGFLTFIITCPSVAITANAALVSLQSPSAYTEAVSTSVVFQTVGGPITYQKNDGASVNLPKSGAIWDADNKLSPLVVWPISDTILNTDNVSISVPSNCVSAAAGIVPAITNQQVNNKVGKSVSPAVPAKRTMRPGFNLMPPGTGVVPTYSNSAKNCSTLIYSGSGQSPALTPDGYPQYTAADGSWNITPVTIATNPAASTGFPGWPLTGTTTFEWDGATGFYPNPSSSSGTLISFISVNSGHATGNIMQVAFSLDGSNTTVAPTWLLRFNGLIDFADDADTGRATFTGNWTTVVNISAWNGGYHHNDKIATSKTVWSLGSLPPATWFIAPNWIQNAGNTTTANYVVKESGSTILSFTRDQTGAPSGQSANDLNGSSIEFSTNSSFTCSGGPITVELTGGTDGFCIADCIFIKVIGSIVSGTPFAPVSNLKIYDPEIDLNNITKFHPNYLKAIKNTYFNRSMQLQGAIASAMSNFADYSTATQICYGAGARRFVYLVTELSTYLNPNGFFPSGQGCALFTVTAVNNAPLPLVNGQPFTCPDNLVVEFADSSGSITFSNFLSCVEYDPVHMSTNQFAMSNATSGGGIQGPITPLIPTPPATNLGGGTTAYVSIPWDDYFQSQAPSQTCWPNVTPITTQACINSIADSYMANMPVGSVCMLEIGNEPFTGQNGYPYRALFVAESLQLGAGNQPMTGYTKLATDRQNWFYTRLQTQGRGGELRRVFNCLIADSGTFTQVCAYLDSNNLATSQDVFVIGPYLSNQPVNQSTQVALASGLTAAQLGDTADAYWAIQSNNFYPELANYQNLTIARTNAGKPCALGGYEGGVGIHVAWRHEQHKATAILVGQVYAWSLRITTRRSVNISIQGIYHVSRL